MYQKFIITRDGVLKFGKVYLHHDLLDFGEDGSGGGGLWKHDPLRGAILLYGRSFEFGLPDFDILRKIDWKGSGGTPSPLLSLPAPMAGRICCRARIRKTINYLHNTHKNHYDNRICNADVPGLHFSEATFPE
jgi:hypothetical protein